MKKSGLSGMAGIGVDIVETKRIRGIRFLRRFAEYFMTQSELALLDKSADQTGFVTSRFAAKEAVIKAFPHLLKPHDFEILKKGAKPFVHFTSARREKTYRAMVSLSHSTDYAAGYATVFKKTWTS